MLCECMFQCVGGCLRMSIMSETREIKGEGEGEKAEVDGRG